jgi:aminoglycoside 3-N-acetyltransferase I
MDVRRLRPVDAGLGVETIRRLKAPEGYPVPTESYFEGFLARPENVFIVATDEAEPIGYVVAYLLDRIDRQQPMMFFYEIEVASAHRRRGVGRRMVHVLKTMCRQENAMKMWVPTARTNVAATRLYASTGAAPPANDDEVTYVYSRESFAEPL